MMFLAFCGREGSEWHATVHVDGTSVTFVIGGIADPYPAPLQHARDIVGDFSAFQKVISEFLISEAKRLHGAAHEIEPLKIQEVVLTYPNRAKDGMIYFTGPSKYRLWRCDYIDGRPKDLGFDD
jgi:hypothetical protein